MLYSFFYANFSYVGQSNLNKYMKFTKIAQLAAVGITVATGLMPLDAEARGRRGGGDRQARTELSEDYAPETDYSGYSSEEIATTIVSLEAEYEDAREELSSHREEGKDLRLQMKTLEAEIEATEDIVTKATLEEELVALEALKDEFKEEKSTLREERRALKKEIRYLENLNSEEAVAEEETTEQL